jgi:hypothetical protein
MLAWFFQAGEEKSIALVVMRGQDYAMRTFPLVNGIANYWPAAPYIRNINCPASVGG